jgi:hypothetical protein
MALTNQQKQNVANYIAENCPEQLLEQFVRLTELYNENKDSLAEDLNNKQRFDRKLYYINNSYNALNIIAKCVAISSSGEMDRVVLPKEATDNANKVAPNTQQKVKVEPEEEVESFDAEVLLGNNEVSTSTVTESASSTKVSNKEAIKFYKPINPKDVLIGLLTKTWGIPENSFLYNIMLSLIDIAPNDKNTSGDVNIEYKELIKNIAEALNRPVNVISSSISSFVRKRRFFEDTGYFICFKDSKNKAKINKEVFLTTIYKFILENK